MAKAIKDKLDANVDTSETRPIMAKHWLRPFTRVPDAYYLNLARAGAAKLVQSDALRSPQAYYFDGVQDLRHEAPTFTGEVERIRGGEAVKNMTRWLMVDHRE